VRRFYVGQELQICHLTESKEDLFEKNIMNLENHVYLSVFCLTCSVPPLYLNCYAKMPGNQGIFTKLEKYVQKS
jgi:hypothetical protein